MASTQPSHAVLLAQALIGPLTLLARLAVALALIGIGLLKLGAAGVVAPSVAVQMLCLATGAPLDAPVILWLVSGLQIVLGLGLLVPRACALAAFGCLLSLVGLVIGAVAQISYLHEGLFPTAAGLALTILAILLLTGAALGCQAAKSRPA